MRFLKFIPAGLCALFLLTFYYSPFPARATSFKSEVSEFKNPCSGCQGSDDQQPFEENGDEKEEESELDKSEEDHTGKKKDTQSGYPCIFSSDPGFHALENLHLIQSRIISGITRFSFSNLTFPIFLSIRNLRI